jgi:SAM-dependent methyltransferase
MSRQDHWNHVYDTKPSDSVSWFQRTPTTSLNLLDAAGLTPSSCVIDVGGGDSRLVDSLLDRGLECLTVLDISATAIARAQARLGPRGSRVSWIVADGTGEWAIPSVDIWHDRAVFHFLVEEADRAAYVANLRRAVKPRGHVVMATFAPDGPSKCSGLPVTRYSDALLQSELGAGFELVQSFIEPHQTPMGTTQSFLFALFQRKE